MSEWNEMITFSTVKIEKCFVEKSTSGKYKVLTQCPMSLTKEVKSGFTKTRVAAWFDDINFVEEELKKAGIDNYEIKEFDY